MRLSRFARDSGLDGWDWDVLINGRSLPHPETTRNALTCREARVMEASAVVSTLLVHHRRVYDPAVGQGGPRPGPVAGPGPRDRGGRAGAARRRAVVVGAVAVLGLVAGGCTVSG